MSPRCETMIAIGVMWRSKNAHRTVHEYRARPMARAADGESLKGVPHCAAPTSGLRADPSVAGCGLVATARARDVPAVLALHRCTSRSNDHSQEWTDFECMAVDTWPSHDRHGPPRCRSSRLSIDLSVISVMHDIGQ